MNTPVLHIVRDLKSLDVVGACHDYIAEVHIWHIRHSFDDEMAVIVDVVEEDNRSSTSSRWELANLQVAAVACKASELSTVMIMISADLAHSQH